MLNRRHLSHIALNVAGMVLPMLVGVAVIPSLIVRLGPDRFGMLTLGWTLVGYFGLLDLGLGRALTQYLSQHHATGMSQPALAAVARMARRIMWALGAAWVALLLLLTPWIGSVIHMSAETRTEAPVAWAIMAFAVPFLMWSTCSSATLEARNRFGTVNMVRIPSGIASFCIPWAIALYSVDLRWVMAGLLLMRIATAATFAWLARHEFANPSPTPPPESLRKLLHFGSWLTVSNLVGPLLSYFDRFAIAALLSMAAVTHYTVPFDVLTRLPALPIAMMGVLFPLLAHAHGASRSLPANHLPTLLHSATRLLVACWLPGMVGMALLGPWLLHWWLGRDVAQHSIAVWPWLAMGVLVNGFAHLAFTLLQSAGRTDLIAKIHLWELPPYCLALWWALLQWGIVGAAIVWTLRVTIDAALLFICSIQQFPALRRMLLQAMAWAALGLTALILWYLLAPTAWVTVYETASLRHLPPQLGWGLCLVVAWCGYHLHLFLQKK